MTAARRNFDDLLEDLAEAVDAAAELVALGKDRWEAERPLRLAGEAVVGRLGGALPWHRPQRRQWKHRAIHLRAASFSAEQGPHRLHREGPEVARPAGSTFREAIGTAGLATW